VTCDDAARDFDPYIDRELEPDASAALRDHVETCNTCRRHLAERETLGRIVRSAAYHPAPDRLRTRVSMSAARSRSTRHFTAWAAAAVLALSIGGTVSVLRSASVRGDVLVESIVDSHVRSLMEDHLFDVRSTDQHTVKPWFLGKLDFAPPVADLASMGFPLVGGRLEYVDGRPAAALVYQRQKHTINVFISPARGSAAVDARAVRGFHVRHWMRSGMSFWAVSDLNEAELSEFVRALQTS